MEDREKKIARKQFKNMIEGKKMKQKPTKTKKFLAVFDGLKFSQSTLDYALQLAKETDAFLVGVFLAVTGKQISTKFGKCGLFLP